MSDHSLVTVLSLVTGLFELLLWFIFFLNVFISGITGGNFGCDLGLTTFCLVEQG